MLAALELRDTLHARELTAQCDARARAEDKAERIVQVVGHSLISGFYDPVSGIRGGVQTMEGNCSSAGRTSAVEYPMALETLQVRREYARHRDKLQASRQQKRQSTISGSPEDAEGLPDEVNDRVDDAAH